jgi:D-aminoacyl-tRNA deacylase
MARTVVQRVLASHVEVDGKVVGRIEKGLLVLVGIGVGDSLEDVLYLADRVIGLRIFADEQGKMNLSCKQLQLAVLAVSQFTLYADVKRGRRPGFSEAASPDLARELYAAFCAAITKEGLPVEQGVFQADMKVHLINDGPVTILIDSKDRT